MRTIEKKIQRSQNFRLLYLEGVSVLQFFAPIGFHVNENKTKVAKKKKMCLKKKERKRSDPIVQGRKQLKFERDPHIG